MPPELTGVVDASMHSKLFFSSFRGVLIGRGGESINAMCRETGARIEVAREDAGAADAWSMIRGTPAQKIKERSVLGCFSEESSIEPGFVLSDGGVCTMRNQLFRRLVEAFASGPFPFHK